MSSGVPEYVMHTPLWARVILTLIVVALLGYALYTSPGSPIAAFSLGDTVVFKADSTLRGVVKDIKCRSGNRHCDYTVTFAGGADGIRSHSMEEYELLPAK
jgi:hypothetical protein